MSLELSAVITCEAVEEGGDEKVLVMRRMGEMMVVELATGTQNQKRGSKQGEALTSACFTFERDRRKRRKRGREQGRKSKRRTKGRNKTNSRGEEHKEKLCERCVRDIRQMHTIGSATGRQQSTGRHTHKATGRSQAAAARGHHCATQAASNSPQIFPIIRLHPKTYVLQHRWLRRVKM